MASTNAPIRKSARQMLNSNLLGIVRRFWFLKMPMRTARFNNVVGRTNRKLMTAITVDMFMKDDVKR